MKLLPRRVLLFIGLQLFFHSDPAALAVPSSGPVPTATVRAELRAGVSLLILGDSLTEGYGVPKKEAFPDRLEKLLNEKAPAKKFTVINGGVSGATSASAVPRLKWYLKAKPSIIVIALGANDGLRGLKPAETRRNLAEAIELAKKSGAQVVLAGMKMPPNYGESYRNEFEAVFRSLAKAHRIRLIPFLLEGVAGVPSMNIEDGIHPNAQGHDKLARTVLAGLEPLL